MIESLINDLLAVKEATLEVAFELVPQCHYALPRWTSPASSPEGSGGFPDASQRLPGIFSGLCIWEIYVYGSQGSLSNQKRF